MAYGAGRRGIDSGVADAGIALAGGRGGGHHPDHGGARHRSIADSGVDVAEREIASDEPSVVPARSPGHHRFGDCSGDPVADTAEGRGGGRGGRCVGRHVRDRPNDTDCSDPDDAGGAAPVLSPVAFRDPGSGCVCAGHREAAYRHGAGADKSRFDPGGCVGRIVATLWSSWSFCRDVRGHAGSGGGGSGDVSGRCRCTDRPYIVVFRPVLERGDGVASRGRRN